MDLARSGLDYAIRISRTLTSDNGLKEHLSEDYYYVGQMVGIALLQNGQLPVYIPEEILQAIFIDKDQELSPCVRELKRGMDTLGIPMFGRVYPMLLYLLRPCSIVSLTVRKLFNDEVELEQTSQKKDATCLFGENSVV